MIYVNLTTYTFSNARASLLTQSFIQSEKTMDLKIPNWKIIWEHSIDMNWISIKSLTHPAKEGNDLWFKQIVCSCCLVAKLCLALLRSHGLQPTRLLCPWDFPGKDAGVGCHFLLQGIFLIRRLNLHLLYPQADSLTLSHQGSQVFRYIQAKLQIKMVFYNHKKGLLDSS